jgi:AraC-like DNA-binding protein
MEHPAPARPARIPHTAGGLARLAYARLEKAGVPALPLLREAGITLDQIRDESVRLKVRDQIKFLNLVSEALNDDVLGFDLAMEADFRNTGLLYYVMSSSANLKEALERASRYSVIVNEGVIQEFRRSRGYGIEIRYVDVSRYPDRHQIEFWMAAIVRICRELSGRRITPRCVRFVHNRKSHNVRFREIFGDNLEFGATADEVAFSENLEMVPVIGADQYLNRFLVKYCEEALADRPGKGQSFQSSVENAIVPLLPHGKAAADEIAHQLGVSKRTLARRLSSEGLSFSKLLEDLKLHLAMRYLADAELSVSQIAWLLGYQEIGAFSRAFKHWTGKTPRETRSAIAA